LKHTLFAFLLLLPASAPAAGPDADGTAPEIVVLYDFYDVGGQKVFDGSGKGHGGTLVSGEVASGRNKPAVRFAGEGVLTMTGPSALGLESQPLTVGAMCRPAAPDGVIVAMGDERNGFSLYLQGGVARFAVRAGGVLREVAAPDPLDLDQWAHVAGVLDAKGGLSLLVDTWPVARAEGQLLSGASPEPLAVGADPGSFVGGYASPLHWQGLLQDVRVYRGVVSRDDHRDLLGEWAQRPGCGCRK
jgi:hypothetical protein